MVQQSFGEHHEGIIINNMAQLQENPNVSRIAWGQKTRIVQRICWFIAEGQPIHKEVRLWNM